MSVIEDALRAISAPSAEMTKLRNELEGARQTAAQLQERYDKVRQESADWFSKYRHAQTEAEEAKTELDHWRTKYEVDNERWAKVDEITQKNETLQAQNDGLLHEKQKLTEENAALRRQIAELSEQMEKLEITLVQREIVALTDRLRELGVETEPTESAEADAPEPMTKEEARRQTALSMSLDEALMTGLSVRVVNSLKWRGYETIGEVCECTALELVERVHHFGVNSANELAIWLSRFGVELPPEEEALRRLKEKKILRLARANLVKTDELEMSYEARSFLRERSITTLADIVRLLTNWRADGQQLCGEDVWNELRRIAYQYDFREAFRDSLALD